MPAPPVATVLHKGELCSENQRFCVPVGSTRSMVVRSMIAAPRATSVPRPSPVRRRKPELVGSFRMHLSTVSFR